MKPRFFAARGLFFTIFLWFFAAQILVGAALYALAATTANNYDRGTFELAGGYIQARAQAAAIAYELGGQKAVRQAWATADTPDDGPNGGPNAGRRGGPDGEPGDRPDDGPGSRPDGGLEDRRSAALYRVQNGRAQWLAGTPVAIDGARLAAAGATSDEETLEGARGGLWLVRRIKTGRGNYLGLIRLHERGGPGGPGGGRGGGPGGGRGFWQSFLGGGGPPEEGGAGWNGVLRWGVIALVVGALCYGLARYLTAPALEVSRAARAFAAGDYAVRVGPKLGARRDELAELGHDFDLMAARIETQRAAERRLLGDISHELRSPLARLRVALDLADQGADARTRGYLARIEEEVEELGELIGQLLTLTRLENAGPLQNAEVIDLAELVAHVCADADFEASATGRTVELRASAPAQVEGDAALLRSALQNVVRNALIHAPDSGVEVTLQTRENTAIVRVRDWGPGAPEAALEALFQPFFRVATARDRQSGGTGLGLSITQRALASHGGSVRAFNAEGGGLEVEMRLPLLEKNKG